MPDAFLSPFNFEVILNPALPGTDIALVESPKGAFSEVTGLEVTVEQTQIREGGYNAGVRQLAGKTSHAPLVLKRGVTLDAAFWQWVQDCIGDTFPLPYVSGEIRQRPLTGAKEEAKAARWSFANGMVTKVRSSDLNAATANAVPIEELNIAHEGLWRVSP